MANEVQDNSMAAPKTEEAQVSSEEATICDDLPMSIHGAGEPSTLMYDGDDEKNLEDKDDEKNLEDTDDDMKEDHPNTLEYADLLMGKGSTALDENDFFKAAECFSRALEIRVANFGELDKQRCNAYYYYGYALVRHVLDDAKEDGTTQAESTKNSVSSNVENDEDSDSDSEDSATGLKEEENNEIEIGTDDSSSNDEDENELDLAWTILDFARVISETRPTQSMNKVYILCALGEVNCYRDNRKTSLEDYLKASHILESLVEPSLMDKARLYFKMGLCLEEAVMIKEARLFFDKALKCCCSVLPLLVGQLCGLSSSRITLSESGEEVVETSTISQKSEKSNLISKIEEDVAKIRDYTVKLECKLKELDEIQNTPKASLEEAIDGLSNKVRQVEENVSTSCTTSTDLQVRNFGKLGGGSVKKISADMYSDSIKSSPSKKPKLGYPEAKESDYSRE